MRKFWWYLRLGLWLRVYSYGMSGLAAWRTGGWEEYRQNEYSPREAVRLDLSYL